MHYKFVFALVSAVAVTAVVVVPKDESADAASSGTTTPVAGKDYFADETCLWFGTAPFCQGSCPAGWRLIQRERLNCWRGAKVYCCRQ
ncbi:hypothetical protein ACQRIT_000293 [Beauveria bassiana]